MDNTEKKILEHDYALKSLSSSIKDLVGVTKDNNGKLDDIVKSIGKQELILEKLANIEANSKSSINRVHNRINMVEDEVAEYKNRGEKDGCSALKVLKEKENSNDIKLESNIKSNQHRISKIESMVTWLARSVIGTLVTGMIGLLFFFAKQ